MASAQEKMNESGLLRKLGVPLAVSAVGAAIGLVFATGPKKRLRETVSGLKDVDVGDLAGDLRGKLDSMRGEQDEPGGDGGRMSSDELQERLQERAKRRARRRKASSKT